ncbi:MAG: TetR/AcrR family transcriptional regulator [Polyangiales bacterium]
MSSRPILEPKKRPQQARSRATFDAIVTACEELLPERGYLGLTTNTIAERAGVSIASLYEYFHTKDAIVVEVVDRAIERVIHTYRDSLTEAFALPPRDMLHHWIRIIYAEAKREEKLASALLLTFPFILQVPSVLRVQALVTDLVRHAYATRPNRETELSAESLYLMQAMTAGTVLSLVLRPTPDTDPDAVLSALADRIYAWTEREARPRTESPATPRRASRDARRPRGARRE